MGPGRCSLLYHRLNRSRAGCSQGFPLPVAFDCYGLPRGAFRMRRLGGQGASPIDIRPESPYALGRMPTRGHGSRTPLLQGTLDLLVLRTLTFGRQHGQGIANAIQQTSRDSLLVEHGSLYPALQRMEERGWIRAEWATSENSRRARFYELTRLGRTQLVRETNKWRKLTNAIGLILGPAASRG